MRLAPMTQAEFEPWLARSVEEYAQDKIKAGAWQPEVALERSRREFEHLLPDGPPSAGQYLYNLEYESTDYMMEKKLGEA